MWSSLIGPVAGLLGKFVEDKDKANQLAYEIDSLAERQAHDMLKDQVALNKIEAGHRSVFVAGWRPFVGWICGLALAWHFLGAPILIFVFSYLGMPVPLLPEFEMDSLLTVLLGMLGLGGMRTFEKLKNKA
jgi:hypothetical protein